SFVHVAVKALAFVEAFVCREPRKARPGPSRLPTHARSQNTHPRNIDRYPGSESPLVRSPRAGWACAPSSQSLPVDAHSSNGGVAIGVGVCVKHVALEQDGGHGTMCGTADADERRRTNVTRPAPVECLHATPRTGRNHGCYVTYGPSAAQSDRVHRPVERFGY